ncbi:MAG: VWA domain-containing protein [Candidatus Marinimicrobia bacterium]|nr:VWA domain-containing protein [Candidatus Neomarinimicrobiota bacterium]
MIDFRYPAMLYFYLPVGILWIMWFLRNRKSKKLFTGSNPALESNLFGRLNRDRLLWKKRLQLFGLIFLLFAASGPQIGTRLKPIERKGVDLVFAIDVSVSMDAEDVKPSRIEKAKFEISQMIKHLSGDRVGLIVFAGSSNLYLPLTSDYEAALLFLDAIDTRMIPTQGTDLSTALHTALNAFPEESEKYKVLTLVSDGEDHEGEAIKVAADAAQVGIVINTVGVGTAGGSLIPIKSKDGQTDDYKRDSQGRLITSVLNERILQEIAQAGSGIHVRFDNRFANYRELLADINSMEKRTIKTHEYSQFEDRYQLFTVFALLFFITAFIMPTRRKQEETWRGRIV